MSIKDYLKIFIFGYLVVYISLNYFLRGKVSIGFISWLQLFNVKINLKRVVITIESVSVQIRPFYWFNRNQLKALHNDGFIIFHVHKLQCNTNNMATYTAAKSSISKPKKGKKKSLESLILLLRKLRWIFPITFVFHDVEVLNDKTWLRIETLSFSLNSKIYPDPKTKVRMMENAVSLNISNILVPTGKVLIYSKCSIHSISELDNVSGPKVSELSTSFLSYGFKIDIDRLKLMISKLFPKPPNTDKEVNEDGNKHRESLIQNVELQEKLDRFIQRFHKVNAYFAFDDISIKNKGATFAVKNMSYAINTIKKRNIMKSNSISNLFKVTVTLNSLDVCHSELPNSSLNVEIYNHVSIMNLASLVYCFKNITNTEIINQYSEDRTFLARNFFTITNSTMYLSLKDLLKLKNKSKKKEKSHHKDKSISFKKPTLIIENLLRLTHNIRTRAQFLTTNIQLHLADDTSFNFGIDDILLDSASTDNIGMLFQTEDAVSTKSLFSAWRNLQLCVVEGDIPTKMFTIELIDTSCAIVVNSDSVKVSNLLFNFHTIDLLLEDILIVKKLAKIADDVVNLENHFAAEHENEVVLNKDTEDHKIEEILETTTEDDTKIEPHIEKKSKFIPEIIENFKLSVDKVRIVACFENPVKYWDGEDQTSINTFKRGLSTNFKNFTLVHDNTVEIPISNIKLAELDVELIRDYNNEKLKRKFEPVLNVKNFHSKYTFFNHRLSLIFPIVDMMLSVEVFWTFFFVKTVLSALKGRKSLLPSKQKKKTGKEKQKLDLLIAVPLLMMKINLPTDISLALEIDSLQYTQMAHKDLRFKVARLYCQNPQAAGYWTVMVLIANARFRFIPLHLVPADKIETHVICDDVRIEIPYQYVFYKAFDNFKAFFKSIKKIKLNFENLMYIEEDDISFQVGVIAPHMVDFPFKFPTIRVKSKRIEYCNHDDPFEEELTRQIMLGQIEQKMRISKYVAFEQYEQEMLTMLKEKYKDCLEFDGNNVIPPDDFNENLKPQASSVSSHQSKNQSKLQPTSKLVKEVPKMQHTAFLEYKKEHHFAIEIPRNRLFLNMSKSWISRIKTSEKTRKHEGSVKGRLGNDPKVRKEFLRKFPIIVEGEFQPLFGFKVDNAVLDLKEPNFGLPNYPEFMHKTARGMPRDMKYSIFAAMNLQLSCSQAGIQIKDYPLPLIGFGGAEDDGPKTVVFKGDFVICEQMNTPEEIRYNFVPCVPQYKDERMKDSLYAFHIARTMTNVKFVTDMDVYVDSTRSACVSWSPALKPGIGYAFGSFDFLSKPPLDISDKIGFWDKFPMIIPSRFRFHLKKGITLFIKSGQSPYNLIGRNSGLAFKWDEDVKILINKNDKPEDFLIVESKIFEIGVPVFDPSYITSLLRHGTATAINYNIAKVLLKLTSVPIIWKLGFVFERNKNHERNVKPGSVERTREFIPHYDVSLRNPATFKSEEEKVGWDSYRGYRSDYMYMALSLYSRDDKNDEAPHATSSSAYNSLYLTPNAFFYFFYWWNSFKSKSGLPIKAGKMFKNEFLSDVKSPKFGNTIFGISYVLDLAPLYLTHVYQHSAMSSTGSNLAFTGLKCFVKSFTMDLHQSKRDVIVLDNKTNTVSKVLKFSMDRCIIDFVDADLRILTAVFNQSSATGMLAKELGIDRNNRDFSDSEASTTDSEEYMDRLWFDRNDFVELESLKITSEEPKWRAYQFASSPRFYYVRENHKPEVDFRFDDAEADTHHCQLNSRNLSEAAPALIKTRIDEIVDNIKFHEVELEQMPTKPQNSFTQQRKHTIETELNDLKYRHKLLLQLENTFGRGVFPEHDEFVMNEDADADEFGYPIKPGLSRVSTAASNAKSRISDAGNNTSNYRNRFIIYAINVTWTRHIKLGFMRYLEKVKDRRFLSFSMSQQALRMAEDLYKCLEKDDGLDSDLSFLKSDPPTEFKKSRILLEDFDKALHDTTGMIESEIDDSYILKLVMPQISISNNKHNCIQLSSNQIVLRNVYVNGWSMNSATNMLTVPMESRIGVTLTDSFVYVLSKDDMLKNNYKLFTPKTLNWPPRLPIEMYYHSAPLDECVVAQGLSCALLYCKPNELHYSEGTEEINSNKQSTLRVIAPDIIATVNSSQYATLYEVGTTFLQKEETDIQKMKELVKKFVKYSDFTDYKDLYTDLNNMQKNARELLECRRLLINLNYNEDDDISDEVRSIIIELERILLNLNAIVDILQTSKSKRHKTLQKSSQWNIMAPVIKLVLLNEDKSPFVELSAIDSYYMSSKSAAGVSIHTAYIYDFAIFDKHKNATLETVVSRLNDSEGEMCRMDWELSQPVGGIEVVKNKSIHFSPLKVEFDMRFSTALQSFLFPKSKILQNYDYLEYDSDEDDLLDDNKSVLSDSSSSLSMLSSSTKSSTKDESKFSKVLHKLMPSKSRKQDLQSLSMSTNSTNMSRSSSLSSQQPEASTLSILNEPSQNEESHESRVKIMEERSKKYFMVHDFIVDKVNLVLTFKGTGKLRLVNLTDFKIETPIIRISDRITSYEELFAIIKHQLTNYVLKHTHTLIRSTLRSSKSSKGSSKNPKINPLLKSKYRSSIATTKTEKSSHHHHSSTFGDPDLLEADFAEHQREIREKVRAEEILKAPKLVVPESSMYNKLDDVEEE